MRRTTSQRASLAGAALMAFLASAHRTAEPGEGRVIQRLELDEQFDVSHPSQIVDFDLKASVDPARVHLLDADGRPVPFQVLEGGRKVAVQTDLPAHQSRRWTLVDGPAPGAPPSGVRVIDYQDNGRAMIQVTNGLTGVRVPRLATTPSPLWKPPVDLANYGPDYPRLYLPAPVQGVLYRSGRWSATGPNGVVFLADRLVAMEVGLLERGPLKVVVQVRYTVDHPEYRYAQTQLRPAGQGFYNCTITIEAGQPSILFEEDTDLEMTWSMDLYTDLAPTTARYRGHDARRKEYGYDPDGRALGPERAAVDAQVDLQFDKPVVPGYARSDSTWAPMSVWDPWARDTGWYWQLFDAGAAENANLVGFFTGRASAAIGNGASGVCLYTLPARENGNGPAPAAGISVASYRRSADARVFPRSRFQWGLFLGVKGQDLKSPSEVQPINIQMNLHGGFNLNKVSRYTLDFPDPPGGYGGLFMDRAEVEALKRKLREDTGGLHGKGLLARLYDGDAPSRPLIDAWTDITGNKLRSAVAAVNRTATEMLAAFVGGAGIYDRDYHYWHGGLAMMRHGIWIDQILADPRTTEGERRSVKAAAVLFASVLWDDDFVPMDNYEGFNLGTANMPVQQSGYRRFYALLLARHPSMAERAGEVEASSRATVRRLVNEHGAEIGCPHYVGASFAPTLHTLLQLKQLGREDPFLAEPLLSRFAEFLLNLQTPPEPRVGGRRALISLGDSSTEPSELFGVLGTGFRDADPRLSARLLGAWDANGKPHSSFFGTTLVMIDESLPAADPVLGDANFPGYYSVLRHGWGTPDETSIWFVNGDHYSDHRHSDQGSLVIYALGKPLSVDWGSVYTPQAPGAYMHSGVVLEKSIGCPWDQDAPPLTAGGTWETSTQEIFRAFEDGAYARASFTSGQAVWTRSVLTIRAGSATPILVIRDTFSGDRAAEAKVLTLNLMADGEVTTPSGKLIPPLRRHPPREQASEPGKELPSVSQPFDLPAGVSQLGFSGRYDVDWNVYLIGDGGQRALVGNWAVTPWGGAMTDKEERQHILRVRGTGSFITLIVPWHRGAKPDGLTVRREGDSILVRSATFRVRIEKTGYTISGRSGTATRTFGGSASRPT